MAWSIILSFYIVVISYWFLHHFWRLFIKRWGILLPIILCCILLRKEGSEWPSYLFTYKIILIMILFSLVLISIVKIHIGIHHIHIVAFTHDHIIIRVHIRIHANMMAISVQVWRTSTLINFFNVFTKLTQINNNLINLILYFST